MNTTEASLIWLLYLMSHELWYFSDWLVGKDTIPSLMWEPGTNPFRYVFLFLFSGASLFPHMHALIRPSADLSESSLSETLFSLAVCPTNSSHLGSPRFSVLSPQIRELHWVPCAFFRPEPVWNTLNARYSPGNHRAHLICFLSFRDCVLQYLMPSVLKTIVSYILLVFSYFRWEGNFISTLPLEIYLFKEKLLSWLRILSCVVPSR